MSDLLLPEGTRLLHIGPHKTGTTALQVAFQESRRTLADHDVIYPKLRQHAAALALTGGKGPNRGAPPSSIDDWNTLVRQVAAAKPRQRVMISSEFYCEAKPDTVRRMVDELGGSRVHILVTLRPLVKIMPSAWQQYVRNGQVAPYDVWLEGMLRNPPFEKPTPSFWRRHHHDVVIERWASVVGPDRVTVLVLDESDRSMLTNTVEQMLGLPVGLLQPPPGRSNRSLTLGEIELVRRISIEFNERGWSDAVYRTYVLHMARHLQETRRPSPDEPTIGTPDWAAQRCAEIGAAAAEKIATLGVHVVGDLSTLGAPPDPSAQDVSTPDNISLPVEAACDAVVASIAAGIRDKKAAKSGRSKPAPNSAFSSAFARLEGWRLTAGPSRRLRDKVRNR